MIRIASGPFAALAPAPRWALRHLCATLAARGVEVAEGLATPGDQLIIDARYRTEASVLQPEIPAPRLAPAGPESFALVRDAVQPRLRINRDILHPQPGPPVERVSAVGSDARGLVYALLELADVAQHAEDPVAALLSLDDQQGSPHVAQRSVFRTFASEVQDSSWLHDLGFWDEYFTHLATHRVNHFQLAFGMPYNYSHDPGVIDNYLTFAYPFLVSVPEYPEVRAEGVGPAEAARNLDTLRAVSRLAAERGLSFTLGLWNHAYEFPQSPHQRYPIRGLTPQNHADYCRHALREILLACPEIDAVSVRVHYEGGIHEPTHEFWARVFPAVAELGRPVGLDLHSKGVDARILDAALASGGRVSIAGKFVGEHQGLPYHPSAVRPLEAARPEREGLSGVTNAARRFTRYGYGDFLRADRGYDIKTRIWPGTQRLLESGDPAQVAALALSSTALGIHSVELCEPLSFRGRKTSGMPGGRRIYTEAGLAEGLGDDLRAGSRPSPDPQSTPDPWRKYGLVYRAWGRGLYAPEVASAALERPLRSRYGAGAGPFGDALAAASRVLPLITSFHAPSASCNYYWPEVYENIPSTPDATRGFYDFDTPEPGTFEAVLPFDPEVFEGIDAWAERTVADAPTASGGLTGFGPRYGPPEVRRWLLALADDVEAGLARAADLAPAGATGSPAFRRSALDVRILAQVARFFAHRIASSCEYALHRHTGHLEDHRTHLEQAVEHYRRARADYARIVEIAGERLVRDLGFGDRTGERGHWVDRLHGIDEDLRLMEAELERVPVVARSTSNEQGTCGGNRSSALVLDGRRPAPPRHAWELPGEFLAGKPVTLRLRLQEDGQTPGSATSRSSSSEASGCLLQQRYRVQLRYRRVNQAEDWQSVDMTRDKDGAWTATIGADYSDSPYALQAHAWVFLRTEGEQEPRCAWALPGLGSSLLEQPYVVIPQATQPQPSVY